MKIKLTYLDTAEAAELENITRSTARRLS